MICLGGSKGTFELSRRLAQTFQHHGLTSLALAYAMEDGLPEQFYHVPIDPLEKAARQLHYMGYEKVGLWGISKGAELALTASSLLPGLVNAVVAVSPMNTVCQRFTRENASLLRQEAPGVSTAGNFPYTAFGLEKFPLCHILRKSIQSREITMYDIYLPMLQKPNTDALIQAEKITSPILLISYKMDTMWPSDLVAEQIIKYLQHHNFPYFYRHLSYNHGGHLFVPMDLSYAKLFKGGRGKNNKFGRKSRMDSLAKTLEFVSQW